jgi:iron(III) transport system substrate-binding protein
MTGFYNPGMHGLRLMLGVSILIAASAFAQVAQYDKPDRERFLAEGAKKEGELMLYTSLVPEDLAALGAAFERKYGVKLLSWRANSEKVLQRALTEARAGRHEADAVETNGPQLEALYREKGLQPLFSPHLAQLMPQALRPHGHWVGTRINMFVQSYNTRLVRQDELPKSYADLAHPRWKGRLGIEAEDEDWFAMIVKELGEEPGLRLFREIVRSNGLSVRKGHTLLAGLVASGEIPLALTTYSHGAEKMKQRGAPVEWFAIAPAIGRANGVGIVAKPPHPHAAALFADFLLSPEGQAILQKGGYVPANLRVEDRAQKLPLKFVDPALILDEHEKWKKLWAQIVLGAAR